jgi:O-6-methylguanine DNA methyltransferase
MNVLTTSRFASPLGDIVVFADGEALVALEFARSAGRTDRTAAMRAQLARAYGRFSERESVDAAGAVSRLERYFAGDLAALREQPVRPHGTAFQQRVWNALRAIPAGETRGYGELAASIGAPAASRAVGAANGSNPVSLFIPCHRVISADGSLHGYGGGLDRKRWLLEHESVRFGAVGRARQLVLA